MIRFCDREICCVTESGLDRRQLLQYFLNGHIDELVYVSDNSGAYLGHITYHNLLQNMDVKDAILNNSVALDETIWENARLFFRDHKKTWDEMSSLPVVDNGQRLICFAYDDPDADRELRMLRELRECKDALSFAEVYPQYQSVKISELNELAYFFVKYLKDLGVPVYLEGEMWKDFFASDAQETLDYMTMKIYAEGVYERPVDWEDNLLRSASVEFECIDRIYEENIKKGIVKDADLDREELIDYLRGAGEVVLLGTDERAQDVYDYFTKMQIDVCCFAEEWGQREHRLFGRPILGILEVMRTHRRAVFVDAHEKGSAWGMGRTDFFDSMGYERNRRFFLLRDYMEAPRDCLKSALKGQNVFLAGDLCLCEKLADYFDRQDVFGQGQLQYLSMSDEALDDADAQLKKIKIEEIEKDALCLIATPAFFPEHLCTDSDRREIISCLTKHGLFNFTNYFSGMDAYIEMEKDASGKYPDAFLAPKRIVLGSITGSSGNTFFRGLLDDHPSILLLDYSFLNNNLFWYCIRLSGRRGKEIPSLFYRLYDSEFKGVKLESPALFMEKMHLLLDKREGYVTSQELFVMFHIAFLYMYGRDERDLKDSMIYWEPHFMDRDQMEACAMWLGGDEMPCDIIEVVRNLYMRNGSRVKGMMDLEWPGSSYGLICELAVFFDNIEKKSYANSERMVVRFEDLKRRPEEELRKICKKWEIPWSQTLMKTTLCGKASAYIDGGGKVQDFDLAPVYDTYEKYFSELDRLKIAVICAPWQKKYGYPCVEVFRFSKRDLQELFLSEFRFMERFHFDTEKKKRLFWIKFQNYVRKTLQKARMLGAVNRKMQKD